MAPCNPNPCRGAGMAAIVPASILCAVPFPSSRFDFLCPFGNLGIRNKAVGKLRASIDAEAEADERGPPLIDLQFLGPDAEPDVSNEKIVVVSGDKLLRNIMIDNKLELYDLYGKVMNCGGGGSCGTCLVEIVDGQDLLNERTDTENRYLKKKPNSWRLACQTIVGNKINSGKVTVQRLPQKKRK